EGRRRGSRAEGGAAFETARCPLPPAVPDLLGRDAELARLRAEAAADAPGGVVVSIVGHPGVGKTTLAVSAAHELASRYPDGSLAVDLRGTDDRPLSPRAALEQLLGALGLPARQIPASEPEQSQLFRSLLAGRRVLVLLDNAADEAQVRPLIAAAPGCLTLITCRRALAGLETARWVWLDPLEAPAAADLLSVIVGPDRVLAEPEAATELVALCGNLPLAVRIAGNRLATRPNWSIAYLAGQLRDERTRLSSLSAGDLQVRSAFEMSYGLLSPSARRVFRRLAAIPGSGFGPELAGVAAGMSAAEVQVRLDELVDVNLVQAAVIPGRYQLHDLLRIFAGERLEAEEEAAERSARSEELLSYLLRTATIAGRAFDPPVLTAHPFASLDEAAEWLYREASNWRAAQRRAAAAGRHREVVDLAIAMHWYSDGRTQQQPWDEIFALGAESARALGSRREEAALLNFLGWARYFCLGDNEGGRAAHEAALALAVEIGDRTEQAWANASLGSVLTRMGRPEEALEHARRAVDLSGDLPFWLGQGSIRNVLGTILRVLGRPGEALEVHRGLLADIEKHYDEAHPFARRFFHSATLQCIGLAQNETGDWPRAAETFRRARELFGEGGNALEEADAALNEGRARREAGQYEAAAECLRAALRGFTGVAAWWPRARALAELSTVHWLTGDAAAARRYRDEALALCEELGTPQARALACELA
ncbi:tetratricopeptide repeat protein, partial [Amycolatopsis rhizosphaerae]